MIRAARLLVLGAVVAAAGAPRAEDPIAACRDAARYPTPAHRRDCLGRSSDPRAIAELHEMARDAERVLRAGGRPGTRPEAFASSAGEVAARADTAYLARLAREGEPFDRWFALRALSIAFRQLDLAGKDAARTSSVKRIVEEACRANESASDGSVRAEAQSCLGWVAPAVEKGPEHTGEGGLFSTLSRTGKRGGGGVVADAPGRDGLAAARLACLQGAVRGTIELCYPDMPPLGRDHDLALTAQRHPSPFPRGKPAWRTERLDEASPGGSHTTGVPLRAGELVARRGVRVLGRDGDRFLVFIPIVRGEAEPHATARAVLVVLDAASTRWIGEPWASAACEAGCRTPAAAATSAAGGREFSITIGSAAGADVVRVRWKNDRLEPAPN